VHVLIVAPNWLGDAVMALPAIRDVRRHFSDALLTVGARQSVATIFRAVSGVDRITVLDREGRPPSLSADIGILLPNSFRSAWMLRRGVKERWGYRADFRGVLLTRAVRRPKGKVHFSEYYSYLVRHLGIETGPLTPQLLVPESAVALGTKLLSDHGWNGEQPLVGVAPGAAFGHAKRWPPNRFADLIRRLTLEAGAACVVVGRSEDRDGIRDFPGIDLIGQTDLMTLMGVVSRCRTLIGNDSGALHLAAAMGVPVVGIYGPTDERYSAPLPSVETADNRVQTITEDVFCRPCFMAECPIDHRCMKRISTNAVYESVSRVLQEKPA
jgi:heptosyltransferase-2